MQRQVFSGLRGLRSRVRCYPEPLDSELRLQQCRFNLSMSGDNTCYNTAVARCDFDTAVAKSPASARTRMRLFCSVRHVCRYQGALPIQCQGLHAVINGLVRRNEFAIPVDSILQCVCRTIHNMTSKCKGFFAGVTFLAFRNRVALRSYRICDIEYRIRELFSNETRLIFNVLYSIRQRHAT